MSCDCVSKVNEKLKSCNLALVTRQTMKNENKKEKLWGEK